MRRLVSFCTMSLVLAFLCPAWSSDKEDEQLVSDAAYHLRDDFNKSDCRAFLMNIDDVDRPKRLQPLWMKGCERLHQELGTWRIFDAVSSERLAPQTMRPSYLVQGRAVFSNGDNNATFWLMSYWHVHDGRATLYLLTLEGGGRKFALPQAPPPQRTLTPGNGTPA